MVDECVEMAVQMNPVSHTDGDEHDGYHGGNRIDRNVDRSHEPKRPYCGEEYHPERDHGSLEAFKGQKQHEKYDKQYDRDHPFHILGAEQGHGAFHNGPACHVNFNIIGLGGMCNFQDLVVKLLSEHVIADLGYDDGNCFVGRDQPAENHFIVFNVAF